MADSKRLDILKSLTTHLETISDYDLTGKVWRGRMKPGDESQPPFLIIFEIPPEESVYAEPSVSLMDWYIGIQGYVEADEEHPTDPAHNLMASVKAKLGELTDIGNGMSYGENYNLNGKVESVKMDGGMVFGPEEVSNLAYFGLKITFTIAEDVGDLYA